MPKSRHRKKKKSSSSGLQTRSRGLMMRSASRLPILKCWVSADWKKERFGTVIFARGRPEGLVAASSFIADIGCLGVKSAFGRADLTEDEFRGMFGRLARSTPLIECEPAFAVKLVTGSYEYALALGFKPDPDYFYAREIFGDVRATDCQEEIEFGKDGKPFFFAGPNDNADMIISRLRRKLGPDGFHFIAPVPLDELV